MFSMKSYSPCSNLETSFPIQCCRPPFDDYSEQQSACITLAFLSVLPERFDFRMLDIAAQNISQSDNVPSRKFVQAMALSVMRVDASGMQPGRTVFIERGQKRKLQFVTR